MDDRLEKGHAIDTHMSDLRETFAIIKKFRM